MTPRCRLYLYDAPSRAMGDSETAVEKGGAAHGAAFFLLVSWLQPWLNFSSGFKIEKDSGLSLALSWSTWTCDLSRKPQN